MSTDRLPPGPSHSPAIQTLHWTLQPAKVLEACARRYGDCFTLRLYGQGTADRRKPGTLVMISDPTLIKQVFTASPSLLCAGASRQALQPVFGDRSVLLLDGADHLRMRKLMLPPFHGKRLGEYATLIAEATRREIQRWPLDKPIELLEATRTITLDVILRAVFGFDSHDQRVAASRPIQTLLAAVASPWGPALGGLRGTRVARPLFERFERSIASAHRLITEQIELRRTDPGLASRSDILSMLLQTQYEDGTQLSTDEIRDQLLTLLLAGHETTATALAWCFEYLLHDPRVEATLREELSSAPEESRPYLDAVINEVLRLQPPLAFVDRLAMEPCELGDWRLPAGTTLAPCIRLVHRRADLYPHPNNFLPERFIESSPETYAWLPFGGGTRRCLGASFALLELKVALPIMLQEASLRPVASQRARPTARAIVNVPRRGCRVVCTSHQTRVARPVALSINSR